MKTERKVFNAINEIYEKLRNDNILSPSKITDKHKISRSYSNVFRNHGLIKKLGYGRYVWMADGAPTMEMAQRLADFERHTKQVMMAEKRRSKNHRKKHITREDSPIKETIDGIEMEVGWFKLKVKLIYK